MVGDAGELSRRVRRGVQESVLAVVEPQRLSFLSEVGVPGIDPLPPLPQPLTTTWANERREPASRSL